MTVVGSFAPVVLLLLGGYVVTRDLASLGTVLVFSNPSSSRGWVVRCRGWPEMLARGGLDAELHELQATRS